MVVLGFDDGGYFERSWVWATVALAALGGIALLLSDGVALGRIELTGIGLLAGIAAWDLLSGTWGIPGAEPVAEAKRALVYVTGLAAVLLVVERTSIAALLGGTLAGIGVLSVYGLGFWLLERDRLDPYEGRTLFEPIGYANAQGILAATGVLLAVGFVMFDPRAQIRVGAGAVAAVLLVALALTESRGAWVALGVGLALLPMVAGRDLRRLVVPIAAGVALGAGAAAIAWPSLSLGNRPEYWRVALVDSRKHPLLGSGAGTFDDVWPLERRIDENVRDAHSLYLESLAELGPLGLALVVAAFALPLARLGRPSDEPLVGVAAAAYAAFLVHAGLDWDWEVPAVTLSGLVCAAALLASRRCSS